MFVTIVTSAFTGHAAAGGVIGYTVMRAFRQGVARGLFSNDAGNGAAANLNASAIVKHPMNQWMSAMLGTFITTIIICTCTGFAILLTGSLESRERTESTWYGQPLEARLGNSENGWF